MKQFTCIGHWQSDPEQPLFLHVEATDGITAIKAGEEAARQAAGGSVSPIDPFINTFVIEGHVNLLSSWAG